MRIGYYWPESDESILDQNSKSGRDFFLELIDKKLIIVKNGEQLVDISKFNKEADYFKINNSEGYNLSTTGKITILSYIEYRLKNDNKSVKWLKKYLTQDTVILGFEFTESPYLVKHQNLFHQNAKIEDEHSKFCNSFLLKKTNSKRHRLFLCSNRTFNGNKIRLVLKSHRRNEVSGIVMIYGISDLTLKAHDIIYIDNKHFEIGHISHIHYNDKVKNFYLRDKDFNNSEITSKLTVHKEKIVQLYNNLHINKIPVEFHNFVRCEIRSTIAKNKAPLIPSVIGPKSANFNYKLIDGMEIDTYFSYFKNYSIRENVNSSNNYYNHYLGTHVSKSNNVYIQLGSLNIDYLFYNHNFDVCDEYYGWDPDDPDDIESRITYAERGHSKTEIDKIIQENRYWKELDNRSEPDYGINWDLYNDQLDMDQQDPEFW